MHKIINDVCRQVIIPTIECEDVRDKTCVKLPNAEETTVDVTACVPVVDKPQCDKVTMISGHLSPWDYNVTLKSDSPDVN